MNSYPIIILILVSFCIMLLFAYLNKRKRNIKTLTAGKEAGSAGQISEKKELPRLMIDKSLYDYLQKKNYVYQEHLDELLDKHASELCSTRFYKEFKDLKRRLHIDRKVEIERILQGCESSLYKRLQALMPYFHTEEVVLLLCINFFYPDETICSILDISSTALKQRRTRLKQKLVSYLSISNPQPKTLKTLISDLFPD